jgi:hypothetical protein
LKAFQAEQYLDHVFLDKAADMHLLASADSSLLYGTASSGARIWASLKFPELLYLALSQAALGTFKPMYAFIIMGGV